MSIPAREQAFAFGEWIVMPASGLVVGCQRIDDPGDLDNPADRDAAEFCMLPDEVFALGKIDAEGLVAGDVALLPMEVLADLADRGIGGAGGAAKFDHRHP